MASDLDLTPYLAVKINGGHSVRIPVHHGMTIERAVVAYCQEPTMKFMGSACPRQVMRYITVHGVKPTTMTGATIYPAGIGKP